MTGPTAGRSSLIVGRDLPSPAGEPLPWRRGHPVDVDDPPAGAGHGLPLVLPAPTPSEPISPSGLFSRPSTAPTIEPATAPQPYLAVPAPAPARAPAPETAAAARRGTRAVSGIAALLVVLVVVRWWRRRGR
jgi:hypothetical protein